MTLYDLGYTERIEEYRKENNLTDFGVGRVIAIHRNRYVLLTEQGFCDAQLTGNWWNSARDEEDFPAVGDWIALNDADPEFAIIQNILPRSSLLKRQAAGQMGKVQIIAANIDVALIVQAVDRDFSVNRLERYLTLVRSTDVKPVILLNKIDLISEEQLEELLSEIDGRISDVPVIPISNETGAGHDRLKALIEKGRTYCMLGSSGVGKSTLLNRLSGSDKMRTDSISEKSNRGMHVTTHRELVVLDGGGLLIDNPGMRSVGIADTDNGLESTFEGIEDLAAMCRFSDCIHINEPNCAVKEAVENGELPRDTYENYLNLQKERAHYASTTADRRKKDKKRGKVVKNYKKIVGDKRKD